MTDSLLELILWGSLLFLGYTYLGYPLILALWSWLGRRPVVRRPVTPKVTIVIAAWNETERLAARIENCLHQEYPAELLDIVVVSDGSTDHTETVVRRFDSRRVRLMKLASRNGKAAALNWGVAAASGEISVLAGNYQAISLCPDLIKPWRNRLFFQYVSHKLCRLVAPFALIALLLCNLALMEGWLSYLLVAQAVGYGLAFAGWGLARIGVREQ